MNVKALFLSCDRGLLGKYMRELDDSMTDEEIEASITVAEESEPVISGENIVLGAEYVCGELPPRLEITAYNISSVRSNFRPFTFSVDSLSDNDAQQLSEIIFACNGRAAADMPLTELLGCEVYSENVGLFGKERFMAELLCSAALSAPVSADKQVGTVGLSLPYSVVSESGISLDEMAALLFGGGTAEVSEPSFSGEGILNMLSTYRSLEMFFGSI